MVKIQIISIIGSLVLLFIIFSLMKTKKLKEEYSLLWLIFAIIFLMLSIWKNALDWIAALVGIDYSPAALFLILIMAIFIIMVEFSIIISKQSEWIKRTAQDIGILRLEIEEMKKNIDKLEQDKSKTKTDKASNTH